MASSGAVPVLLAAVLLGVAARGASGVNGVCAGQVEVGVFSQFLLPAPVLVAISLVSPDRGESDVLGLRLISALPWRSTKVEDSISTLSPGRRLEFRAAPDNTKTMNPRRQA